MLLSAQKSIGIDIADRTIEIAELAGNKEKIKIANTSRVIFPPDIVERGRIKNAELLSQAINRALSQAEPEPIAKDEMVFGFPESQTYIHTFELGAYDKNEENRLISKEAQASIPLRAEDLMFSHSIISQDKNKTEILLAGLSKEVFNEWQAFFQNAGLKIKYFDIETMAVFRGLFIDKPESPVCLVDIGAATTTISIFNRQIIRYSYSLDSAGNALTNEIAKNLNITMEQAERMKINTGLSNRNDHCFIVLIKILQPIAEEAKNSIKYFEEKTGENVKNIILVGGSSKLKGLLDYFKNRLNKPVWLGEPALLRNRSSLEYIEAIGLAMRGFDRKQDEQDPIIQT